MNRKNFDPIDVSYSDLFRHSQRQLIPSLQRPYTWDRKNIGKFLKDVIENDAPYFIGSLVFIEGGKTTSREEVIDGQQRITTISLILIALRDYSEKNNIVDPETKRIKRYLFEPDFDEAPTVRLGFTNKVSNETYLKLLKGEAIDQSSDDLVNKFKENYDEILRILEESIKRREVTAIELLNKIESLEIIIITCSKKSYGYKLFESLNATAESLASVDLIKNSLFMILSTDEKLLASGEEKWTQLESHFSESRSMFKTFIRHQWLSSVDYVSHSGLFEQFEKSYTKNKTTPKVALAYIDTLLKDAEIYLAIRKANINHLNKITNVRFDRNEIERTLQFLSFLNVDQIYPILLYIYKNEPSKFKQYLIQLTSFQFLFKFVPGSPSTVEKYFAQFCRRDIGKQELFKQLKKLCNNQQQQFVESFLFKTKYRKGSSGDIQFALEQYLYHFGPGLSYSKPTIEHIIPQRPDIPSKKKILLQFNGDSTLFRKKIHEIGNLTILEKTTNSDKNNDNLPFAKKKVNYTKTNFKANSRILDYNFDTDPLVAINLRGEHLAKDIYGIFLKSLETGKLVNRKK